MTVSRAARDTDPTEAIRARWELHPSDRVMLTDETTARVQRGIAAVIEGMSPEQCHDESCPAFGDEFDPLEIARRIIEGPAQTLLAESRAETERLRTHMHRRHVPRDTEVYSAHHHDADHATDDLRCTDECFEPITLCACCGSAFPCLEIRAFDAALASPTGQTGDEG